MQRRTFLTTSLALGALPGFAFAEGFVDYTPGLIQAALDDGKTVLVDYSAVWCTTCQRQARVINALRQSDPSYDASMVFIKVDWDTYYNHDVTRSRRVPRRSTLLLLKGDQELGRIVAGTSRSQIKELLDRGLIA